MEKPPDLIIPVRMDVDKALARLQKLADQGDKTGNKVDAAAKKAKKSLDETGDSASKAGKHLDDMGESGSSAAESLVKMARTGMALRAVGAVANAIQSEFKRASDYVKTIATEFADLRKTMQEVATLRGQPNSNEFTVQQAQRARELGLTPEEMRDFQAQFLNFAGSQIGPGGKLTAAQGEEYGGRVASMMKQSGIPTAVGAELAGSLLEQSRGPQDVNKLMRRFSETFNVGEKGRVRLERMLPQLSEIMAMGVGPEEAVRLFNIASPASVGQEGVAVQAALRAIDEMKIKGTGAQFGVKPGMSPYESVKAFGTAVNDRFNKLQKGGKTEQEATDEVAKALYQAGVAGEVRERRGLVAGFGRMGVQLGGFKTFEDIAANTPADFEAIRRKNYAESDQGIRNAKDIAEKVAEIEQGAKYQDMELVYKQARTELIREGELETGKTSGALRSATGWWSRVDNEQQMINTRAIEDLKEIGRRNYFASGKPRSAMPTEFETSAAAEMFGHGAKTQAQVNDEIRELLRLIAENTGKNAAKEAPPKGYSGAERPLSAPQNPGGGAR